MEAAEDLARMHNNNKKVDDDMEVDDDGEISVGCPSPAALPTNSDDEESHHSNSSYHRSVSSSPNGTRDEDDYFKPLKKLQMVDKSSEVRRRRRTPSPTTPTEQAPSASDPSGVAVAGSAAPPGVKSFSIMDILNHRPATPTAPLPLRRMDTAAAFMLHNPMLAAASRIVRPWDLGAAMLEPALMMERLHQQNQSLRRLQQQQAAAAAAAAAAVVQHQLHQQVSRPQSADLSSACSSGRSSTASDCCSPSPDLRRSQQRGQGGVGNTSGTTSAKGNDSSPLDALFQMTSKTFEGLNGEQSTEGSASHLNLFNSRQQAKKKRKSRTAFTNHQIFELEKRFLYQKYLSPADRDEIAANLGLSNAQVITWFQNRRAKLKRDMEELKKDVESAKVLTAHKSFLEKVHNLGVLKKKAPPIDKLPEK